MSRKHLFLSYTYKRMKASKKQPTDETETTERQRVQTRKETAQAPYEANTQGKQHQFQRVQFAKHKASNANSNVCSLLIYPCKCMVKEVGQTQLKCTEV